MNKNKVAMGIMAVVCAVAGFAMIGNGGQPISGSTALGETVYGIMSLFLLIGLSLPYFIPAFVAYSREHHQKVAILLLNIFLGWTLIGWVAALVWAATATMKQKASPL